MSGHCHAIASSCVIFWYFFLQSSNWQSKAAEWQIIDGLAAALMLQSRDLAAGDYLVLGFSAHVYNVGDMSHQLQTDSAPW